MKKIWINKALSHQDAEDFEIHYYLDMTPVERLEIVQFLREQHIKLSGKKKYAHRKRLRRSVNIVQQA